jgi:hypothetical protein
VTVDGQQTDPLASLVGPTKQRLRDPEIARELAPVVFLEPPRDPAANELLNIGRVSPEHLRKPGEILPAL